MTACMGGWCASRAKCADYHSPMSRGEPIERRCPPGEEYPEPMARRIETVIQRPVKPNNPGQVVGRGRCEHTGHQSETREAGQLAGLCQREQTECKR